jgi:phospholipase C
LPVRLPPTKSYKPTDLVRHDDEVPVPPTHQRLPKQEPGVRPARALPYALHARGRVLSAKGSFRIDFANAGEATGVFHVRSGDGSEPPRTYTVEPGKQLSGVWKGATDYDLSVYGPNGFLRAFKGATSGGLGANLVVEASYDNKGGLSLNIENRATDALNLTILDNYTGKKVKLPLAPGKSAVKHWALRRLHGWYDLVITVAEDPAYTCQFAGHVETGKDSWSDPAMGSIGSASEFEG